MNKSQENSLLANAFSMSANEVCEALNISRQTLYAYVSRGKVRADAQKGDARKSLYHVHDVENLLASKKRGRSRRAIAKSTVDFGEPVLKSNISHIDKDTLYYKGLDAIKLSQTKTYEEIAKLLIDVELPMQGKTRFPQYAGRNPFERILTAMSELMIFKNIPSKTDSKAYILTANLAAICKHGSLSDAPAHQQLANCFSDQDEFPDIVRRCLVLCADHELNPSAYTARIAASTNASIPACVMAALSTFSGTRHGSMPSMARWWIGRAVMKNPDAQRDFITATKTPPGFGHPIYPQTDPRTAELLKYFELPDGWADVRDRVIEEHGLYPNLDFSLAAMEKSLKLGPKTGQTLFAYGRMIGWIAHAQEQQTSGKLIRPRAWS